MLGYYPAVRMVKQSVLTVCLSVCLWVFAHNIEILFQVLHVPALQALGQLQAAEQRVYIFS